MRKISILFIGVVLIIGVFTLLFLKQDKSAPSVHIIKNSPVYAEYEFNSETNRDSGSHEALRLLEKDQKLLHSGAAVLSDGQSMKYVGRTRDEEQKGVIEKYIAQGNSYELTGGGIPVIYEHYRMLENGVLLFEDRMNYGADGPILDWRIVEGKPAFTYRKNCDDLSCTNEIFYNGKFMGKEHNVQNPRYLFGYNGKIGFVARDQEGDRIFFDGAFITEPFDTIHTHNCCSIQQLLPIVYENGVLLFYGNREEKSYLAEVELQ